jgi:DNA-binding transcriptional ArsR family regulator
MKKNELKTMKVSGAKQRSALASPLRLEILGLFTGSESLAISDMAPLMGRTPGSLYHHVGILEKAGLLIRTGTRPKGKRYEAMFRPAAERIEMEAQPQDGSPDELAVKTMAAAFRMAERDLAAALEVGGFREEGPKRNLFATRMHLRASPRFLAKLNHHLTAIEDLLAAEASRKPKPSPADQHVSLTLALLPLKGRATDDQQ